MKNSSIDFTSNANMFIWVNNHGFAICGNLDKLNNNRIE